ncbi:MAG: 23S rRNA (adenine(2503)-C(2))-methyltransferase RlmN [Candidatus Omnitrophota bacterium]
MKKQDFKNVDFVNLVNYLTSINEPKYRAQQILTWVYQRGIEDFSLMSNLSLKLRKNLESNFYISKLKINDRLISKDKTRKYLFKLEDGNLIESVLIPHKDRVTVCLSTQVGCKFACKFCASGALGFVRNLSKSEILNQVLTIKKDIGRDINNIVFMGIGEPLDNYNALLDSIRVINSKYGFNIGQRKITISTVGIIEGIDKLSKEGLQIELSVSLHSAMERKRDEIMSINKKYPIKKLLFCLRHFAKVTKRKVTFEYLLIGGFNTNIDDAKSLLLATKGLDCKVNLIVFNPINISNFTAPTKLEVLFFRDYLSKNNIDVTIRQSRGQDIEAACGQLRLQSTQDNISSTRKNRKLRGGHD